MKFTIESLILWPTNSNLENQEIIFKSDKISIVHGRSGTGKSSIVSIIDYCLGASSCSIPVGFIRQLVAWFGIKVNIAGVEYLIARKTPGTKLASGEFYFSSIQNKIPKILAYTHNEISFKTSFNSLVGLTNLPLAEEEGRKTEGRPSYRDLAAFNFLPQHIVANPNTLFFKADSYEHKDRLKKIMPLALGVIDSTYMIKERELSALQKEKDSLTKRQEVNKAALAGWDNEVNRLWRSCVELGLANFENYHNKVQTLELINQNYLAGELGNILRTPNYAFTNEQLLLATKQEETLQREVDSLRTEIRNYEQLSDKARDFTRTIYLEKERVISFDWLKSNLSPEHHCVACGSKTDVLDTAINSLEQEVKRVSVITDSLFENPVVDKEIDSAKTQLRLLQDQLQVVRRNRHHLLTIDKSTTDSISKVYVVIGQISYLLSSLKKVMNTDDVGVKISRLENHITILRQYFDSSSRTALEYSADREISALIEKYADGFGLERRGDITLDKKELTLRFDSEVSRRKEYLWEVGSGANWMGYHIATFLALHE